MTNERSFHIWYHGQPQADHVPFSTYDAAVTELKRQLNEMASHGEYATAVIVSIRNGHHKDVQIVSKKQIIADEPAYDLDTLVRIQDALDAMDDTSCIDRDEYVNCNKPEVRPMYATAWNEAKRIVREQGSLRKAANHVQRMLDSIS